MKLLCLLCLVAGHFVLSSGQLSAESGNACREPADVTEMYRTLRVSVIENSGIAEKNVRLSELQQNCRKAGITVQPFLSQDESTTENVQHDVTITTLNDTCHTDLANATNCHCPSRHELNFDPTRIPKALVQTSCCSRNEAAISHWISACRGVYHNVRVLRRTGCTEGVYSYAQQWERLPIGCSCHVISNVFSAP